MVHINDIPENVSADDMLEGFLGPRIAPGDPPVPDLPDLIRGDIVGHRIGDELMALVERISRLRMPPVDELSDEAELEDIDDSDMPELEDIDDSDMPELVARQLSLPEVVMRLGLVVEYQSRTTPHFH